MNNATETKSDVTVLLLCYESHKAKSAKERCLKFLKTAKLIKDRTKDVGLYNKCREVIKLTSTGDYESALKVIYRVRVGFTEVYGI